MNFERLRALALPLLACGGLAPVAACDGGDATGREAGLSSEVADAGRDAGSLASQHSHHDSGRPNDAGGRISFSTCPLLDDPSDPPVGPGLDGIGAAMAQCATVQTPAVWSDPKAGSMELFLKRYPAAQKPADGQFWFLTGGPGASTSFLGAWVYLVAKTIPTLDVYLLDFRGTGRSSFADAHSTACKIVPPPPACLAAVPHLDGLTTTDAARDLASLIDAVHSPEQKVFVYGTSYGTYWAQRYLQIRPDQPSAVILDSTVRAAGEDFSVFDEQFDANANAVLDLCKADATCAKKIGPNPASAAGGAVLAMRAGRCGADLGMPVGSFFGHLISTDYFDRLLLPASIYRILRCDAGDLAWLAKVRSYLSSPSNPKEVGFSNVVFYNIGLSELWQSEATAAEFRDVEKGLVAYAGFPPRFAYARRYWPEYPHDEYYGKWPSSPVPILVLQGTLDPRTPPSDAVKAHYSGQNQYFVEVPEGNHELSLFSKSPHVAPTLKSPTTDRESLYGCAWDVAQSFLADTSRAPDTSCLTQMAPLDWGSPPPAWLEVVGIAQLWENDSADAGGGAIRRDAGGGG